MRSILGILRVLNPFLTSIDGGSRGNPGLGGAGGHIFLWGAEKMELWWGSKYVRDHATNNEAEYEGLILGLQAAVRHFGRSSSFHIQGDS